MEDGSPEEIDLIFSPGNPPMISDEVLAVAYIFHNSGLLRQLTIGCIILGA
jgi:hypothetical protein